MYIIGISESRAFLNFAYYAHREFLQRNVHISYAKGCWKCQRENIYVTKLCMGISLEAKEFYSIHMI